MSFGPEFIYGLQGSLNKIFPWQISKIEGGDSWAAFLSKKKFNEGEFKSADAWLLLSWGTGSAGCCLAGSAQIEALKNGSPSKAPLAETLKSRCGKGQIVAARQLNFDRVLELEIVRFVAAGFGVKYYLVLEATEPIGNLVLLNEERRIEETARHASPDVNRYRTILPGHVYAPPPAFEGPLPSESDGSDFGCEKISRLRGIGRPLSRAIAPEWERRAPSEWLGMIKSVYEDKGVYEDKALICQRVSKGYLTRFPVLLPEAEALGNDALYAAEAGVLIPLLSALRLRLLRELDAKVGRAVKAKERHLEGLLRQIENNAAAELFRRSGNLLLANLGAVPPRAESVTLTEWESGEAVEIALDPKLTPSRNAERYFKKYKKAHVDPRKIQEEADSLKSSIGELKEQRDLLNSIEDPLKLEEAVKDVIDWLTKGLESSRPSSEKSRKGKAPEPPHARFEIDGYTVLVGLSARGNRFVTFKQAAGDDLWLHAHEIPGAHVIIKGARGRESLEGSEALLFAASLAAAHSAGKGALSVQVDYTERRHVRAVPGTVALVTYTQPGTVRVRGVAP